MARLCYLNVTIGVLSALSVALVGVVALLVTATISIEKLQASAEAHSVALGAAVAREVSLFVYESEQQSRAMARAALMGPTSRLPTEHWSANLTEKEWEEQNIIPGGVTLGLWSQLVRTQALDNNMSRYFTVASFADGAGVSVIRGTQDPDVLLQELMFPPDLSAKQNLTRRVQAFLRSTQQPAPPGHVGAKIVGDYRLSIPVPYFVPGTPGFRLYDSLARIPSVPDEPEAQARAARDMSPTWTPTRFTYRGGPQWFRMSVTRLYNASNHHIGFGFQAINVPAFSAKLDGQKPTPGSRSVLIDDKGYVIGASDRRETGNWTNITDVTAVPEMTKHGCVATNVGTTLVSERSVISCQHHIRNFEDPAIRAVADTKKQVTDGSIMRIKVDGDAFFVSITRVPGVGLIAFVIAVVPEEDVLGNVRNIYVIAGLATCGVVLVSSGLLISLVFVSLRPLKGIAERMGKTARLEDTAQDRVAWKGRSVMAEIADLEDAFAEMSQELNRIRAFVPQSLLRANTSSTNDSTSDEDGDTTPHRSSLSGHLSAHRVSQQGQGRLSARHSASAGTNSAGLSPVPSPRDSPRSPHAQGGLETPTGVRKIRVSVLFLNTRGFHSPNLLAAPPTDAGLGDRVAAMVDAVLAIVNDQKGVVDYFHGDRFMVTFNAATICAGHASRAVTTAAKIKAVLRDGKSLADVLSEKAMSKRAVLGKESDVPLEESCGITCGVASGVAQVGNLGISDMMRFTTVGPVVSQAAALERLCKLYTCTERRRTSSAPPKSPLVPGLSPSACSGNGNGASVPVPFAGGGGTGGAPAVRTTLAAPGEETSILLAEPSFDDAAACATLRYVDFVRLPFTRRGCLVAAVEQEINTSTEDKEWLYHFDGDDPSASLRGNHRSVQAILNTAWSEAAGGDSAAAIHNLKLANLRFAAARTNETAALVQPPGLSRLAEAVAITGRGAGAELRPRDLGVFYTAAVTGPDTA